MRRFLAFLVALAALLAAPWLAPSPAPAADDAADAAVDSSLDAPDDSLGDEAAADSTGADSAGADSAGSHAARGTTSTPTDTSLHVTGTPFRFGWTVERVQHFGSFVPSKAAGRGEAARAGAVRWLGVDTEGTLIFRRGHLVRVQLSVPKATGRQANYVEDELTRRGFRRECQTWTIQSHRCTWLGATTVELTTSRGSIAASLTPPGPAKPAPPKVAPPARVAAEPPLFGEVLVLGRPLAEGAPPAPEVAWRGLPEFPEAAREAGVQGNVWVRALVNAEGDVVEAEIARGIEELNEAALACARQTRFMPYLVNGVVHRFRVEMPVRFVLH